MTKTIRLKKPSDPFASEIARRLEQKRTEWAMEREMGGKTYTVTFIARAGFGIDIEIDDICDEDGPVSEEEFLELMEPALYLASESIVLMIGGNNAS